jgi:hypothetical protein
MVFNAFTMESWSCPGFVESEHMNRSYLRPVKEGLYAAT